MFRALILASVMALAAGCGTGDDGATGDDRVVGNWIALRSATFANAFTFTVDGKYASSSLATIDLSTADVELERGTYRLETGRIIFMPAESTCVASSQPYQVSYSWSGPNLAITYTNAIVIFEANNNTGGGSGGTALIFGCFDPTTGAFAPRGLTPVGP